MIHAVVAVVTFAGWLGVSACVGDFTLDEFAAGGMIASALASICWLASRVVQRLAARGEDVWLHRCGSKNEAGTRGSS